MLMDKIDDIKDKIEESQMLLIGIGESVDACTDIKDSSNYQQIEQRTTNKWIMPFVMRELLSRQQEVYQSFYECLFQIVGNRNYFIISTCMDGYLKQFSKEESRIVAPCGQYEQLQCSNACSDTLYEPSKELSLQIKQYIDGTMQEQSLKMPVCPCCGQPLVFNNVLAENYQENGYLPQWNHYTKWLQGTLNRKLTVFELGVGMKYPTVIRWPFEKTVFFNKKAVMYRVHDRLYQITEELKDKAYGICQNPLDFVKELSKEN